MEFKELESERLLLVDSDKKYAVDFLRYMDEETTRYMTNERFKNLQEAENFLEICEDMKQRKITYAYVILHKDTKEFIGGCAISNVDYSKPELGIWIRSDQAGHGYGKEAVECLCAYVRKGKDYEGFLYPVDKENRKSIRLVKELGGVQLDEVEDFKKEDGRLLHLVSYVLPKQ